MMGLTYFLVFSYSDIMPIQVLMVSAQVKHKITLHFAIIVFNNIFYYEKNTNNTRFPRKIWYQIVKYLDIQ
jgi:hypothetical protein